MSATLPGKLELRKRPEFRFVLSFLVIAAILFSVYSFPYPDGSLGQRWANAYLSAYAHMSGLVLRLFDPSVVVADRSITGRYAVRIIRGCDAIDAQILMLAAVFATHVHSWRWRIGGAVVGFLAVTAANVVRICSLYYIGALFPSQFDFFHHEVWPLLLIALAAGLFVLWFKMAPNARVHDVVPEV
jgi:exosortase/archaeosortase family protein